MLMMTAQTADALAVFKQLMVVVGVIACLVATAQLGTKLHDKRMGPLALMGRALIYMRAVAYMWAEFKEAWAWTRRTQWEKCVARAVREQ